MYNKNTKKPFLYNFGFSIKPILGKISFFVFLCVIFPNSINAQPVVVWNNLQDNVLGGTGSSSDNDMMGQQFILTAPNIKITEIKLPMTNNAPNIDGGFTISIYNDNAGKLGTKVADLYTGTNASINLLPTWVTLDNSTAPATMPKQLTAGTFWVVVSGSGIGMDGHYTQWFYDMADSALKVGTAKRNCVYVTTPTEQYFDIQPYFMKLSAAPCSAPTAAASSVIFGTSTASTIKLTGFTAPFGGADGYSIYVNSANSFIAPANGAVLNPNLAYGGGQQCIYSGTSIPNNLVVTGLVLNTTYYFKIYSYNNCTGTTTYETTGTGTSKATAAPPTVTSATYNASSGALVITCADIYAGDNISVSKFTVTGENNGTYQLTTNDVTATNSTTISITLNGTDQAAVAPLYNQNGTASTNNITYNISAAAGWNASVTSALDANNAVNVSGVTSPAVSSVSVPANGTYKINDNMDFTVSFTENITVNTSPGTPTIPITLNTGGVVNASYVSGTGSQHIVFRYQVASGNYDNDGVSVGAAIALNNGTMRNANGTDINTTLNNIAVTSGVKVDGVEPSLSSVTPPSNGIYTTGQDLIFTIKFSEAVTVTNLGNNPSISLNIGGSIKTAYYTGGTGSTDITFAYTVASGNIDTDGIMLNANITLGSSTINDAAGNPAALTFSSNSYANIYVNILKATIATDAATLVSGISATLGGSITADGGAAVTERGVVYSSINNSPTIGGANVTKKINASGLDVFSESIGSLSQSTTYYFQAYATNMAGTQYGGVLNFSTSAGVTSVSVPGDLTYKSGDDLSFTVHFSANITVDITSGKPSIPITLNTGGIVDALYVSGSGSQNLVFTYTIVSGNEDNDGITVGAAITLNGGTLKDPGNVDATLTLNSVGATTGVKVDAKAPTVSSTTAQANGIYISDQDLTVSLVFSEAVTVTGTPSISMTIGSTIVTANHSSGTGTTTLVFKHKIIAGDVDGNGILVGDNLTANGSSISLNTGSIKDAAGNNAVLTFTGFSETQVLVNVSTPTVSSVSVPANGTYKTDDYLNFTVNFSENITVDDVPGIPTIPITLNTGGIVNASYYSGSGSPNIAFRYKVVSGNLDNDGVSVGAAIAANSGTLRNTWETNADLTLHNIQPTGSVKVDGVAPSIISATPPANNIYTTGQDLIFTIKFSEAVTVANLGNNPSISLDLGGTTKTAYYSGGTGTTDLTFAYNIGAADQDVDGIGLNANITLGSSTIKDAAGNPATLTFSSSALSGVYVNIVKATITTDAATSITSTSATLGGSITANGGAAVTERGIVYSFKNNSPTIGGADVIKVINASGLNVFSQSIGPLNLDLTYYFQAYATNLAGTQYGGTLNFTTPTGVTSVSVPGDLTYKMGDVLSFTVNFNSAVAVDFTNGIPSIPITLNTGGTVDAQYISGSGSQNLVFSYTIVSGNEDNDGISMGAATALNGGRIIGPGNLNATLTLNSVGSTVGVKVDAKAPTVSSTNAQANGTYVTDQDLTASLVFSEAVTVTGTPSITMTIGSSVVSAVYSSGTGTTTLVFKYKILAGELDDNGILVGNNLTANGSSISLNTGTIKDAAGNNAVLTFTGFAEAQVLVNVASPTVTTQAASAITSTTATGNGNVTALGAPNPTQHGVVWSKLTNPTIALLTKTTDGAVAATGAFTSNITGLDPYTTYYVKAYATNSIGTSYGDEVSFTTNGVAPTVTTQAVTVITSTTATGNGNITNLGVPNPTQFGVAWSTGHNPDVTLPTKTTQGAAAATGAFTSNIITLSPNTKYYVKAYATNVAGTSYGDEVSFTTNGIVPTVTTQAVTNITAASATGNGNITDLGIPNPTQYGVVWSTATNPTIALLTKTAQGAISATGAFTSSITGLSPSTTYYVKAYATNSEGTSYGTEEIFITSAVPPTTQAKDIVSSNITTTHMTIGWTNGSGAKRIVFVKEGTGTITNPAENTTYAASSDWGVKGDQAGASGYYSVYNGNQNNFTLTGLTANTEYTVQVFEYNGPALGEKYLTTTAVNNPNSKFTITLPPVATAAALISSDGFTANWDPVIGATGFVIDVAPNNLFSSFVPGYSNRNMGNVPNFTVTGLVGSTQYFYRIRAVNLGGQSASSNVIDLTTNVTIKSKDSVVTSNGFMVKWSTIPGAAEYFLDYSTNNFFGTAPAAAPAGEYQVNMVVGETETGNEGDQTLSKTEANYISIAVGNVTDYTLNGLDPATTYFYRVRAANIIGEIISQSSPQSIVTSSIPSSSGTFVFLSPAARVKWQAGICKYIEWKRNNGVVTGTQLLEYSTDGGACWKAINSQPVAGVLRYPWMVPNISSANCLIRISNYITKKVIATMPAPFEIFITSSRVNNYPNPFNPSTIIQFKLEKRSPVTLKIYNSLGQEVALLVNRELEAGLHEYEFNASNYTSGVYYYTLKCNGATESHKMLLLK